MATDPRLCCEFHHDRPAKYLAPRHKGGDEDVPAEWTPICEDHLATWYGQDDDGYEIPEDERLPIFNLAMLLNWERALDDVRENGAEGLEGLEEVVLT